MEGENPKISIVSIIVFILAVIAISGIMALAYYYVMKFSPPPVINPISGVGKTPETVVPRTAPTTVINFVVPKDLPKAIESGNCFASSVADPYRKDAFRCMVKNTIYDPCFTSQKGFVFCQVNPTQEAFLIKLTKALPKPTTLAAKDNWAWYIKLDDGTFCSPFTGTLPPLQGEEMAKYNCSNGDVLVGELSKGTVWTAKQAKLSMGSNGATIASSKKVYIDTVWQ